tara:strand:+ start:13198 stop:13629 length:432 start_codon:yes stop_codon:yes gene_type:complete
VATILSIFSFHLTTSKRSLIIILYIAVHILLPLLLLVKGAVADVVLPWRRVCVGVCHIAANILLYPVWHTTITIAKIHAILSYCACCVFLFQLIKSRKRATKTKTTAVAPDDTTVSISFAAPLAENTTLRYRGASHTQQTILF